MAETTARSRQEACFAWRRLEDAVERGAGREVVDDVVPELRELVEDHVARVERQLVTAVVDLLDVALGSGRADDVVGLAHPALEPLEALAAHPLGEHGDAVAAHQPGDRDAAATVVAGRGPDRAVLRRVEAACDDSRRQAAVGGEHLVRADQREPVAERDDDRRLDAGQLAWQDDVLRDGRGPGTRRVVEPVDAKEVERIGVVRADRREPCANPLRDEPRVGNLGKAGQRDARLTKALDRRLERPGFLGEHDQASCQVD